jgi:hypothetical protein
MLPKATCMFKMSHRLAIYIVVKAIKKTLSISVPLIITHEHTQYNLFVKLIVAQPPKKSLTSLRKKKFLDESTSFGHDLMTHSGLTRPEDSLMVFAGFFCYFLHILPTVYNPSCLLEKFHTHS